MPDLNRSARLRATLETIDARLLELLERHDELDEAALRRISLLETARRAALRLLEQACADVA